MPYRGHLPGIALPLTTALYSTLYHNIMLHEGQTYLNLREKKNKLTHLTNEQERRIKYWNCSRKRLKMSQMRSVLRKENMQNGIGDEVATTGC